MFTGQYNHSLDDKKRLTVPAKFRNDLGGNFYITVGFDKCISIYTEKGFGEYSAKMMSLNSNRPETRQLQRYIFGNANQCQCDSHGRIILPDNLLTQAHISKDVVLVGSIDHIEVWAKDYWSAYESKAAESFEEVAAKLAE